MPPSVIRFGPLVVLVSGVAAAAVVGSAAASGAPNSGLTHLSTTLNCATDYLEMGSPSYDDTVAPDPLSPVERVQAMIDGGILDVQGNPVVLDDSRVDSTGGIVAVGTRSAGTLATVTFASDPTYGWRIEGVASCV